MSTEDTACRNQAQEEIDSTKRPLSATSECSRDANKTRINVFEDVSAAEDAHLVVVSTTGHLISAKKVDAGARATLWLGQISDAAFQHLSESRGISTADRTATDKAVEPETERIVVFDQYGTGRKLDDGGV